jgi:hypothetical protein
LKKLFRSFLLFIVLSAISSNADASPSAKGAGYFELRIYHFNSTGQEAAIDSFLQYQYLSALHNGGINNIGIFKPIGNDTATDKKVYVFVPYKNLKQWEKFSLNPANNPQYGTGGGSYLGAAYNQPAYTRMETIFMKAFELMPPVTPSKLTAPKSERVYELRSYEGASENIYRNKVQMFNQGGEIDIFTRLGFNAVFYGEVIYGSKMPNLMYMTSFENKETRDEHWKAFGSDPAWKTLSARPEYQHNVSHSDITFLRATPYSDL